MVCVLWFCGLTESLLSLKKSRLLASLDAALLVPVPTSSAAGDTSHSNSVADQGTLDMDAEFAAFQVGAGYIYECVTSTWFV